MELVLDRKWCKPTYSIGILYVNGLRFCETCEDVDRGLTNSMSIDEIKNKKVYGETAIPKGTYTVRLTYSNKYKRIMPLIENVKGFEGIRIHSGNTAKDTEGCVLVGLNKEVGKVLNSRVTYDKLFALLKTASDKGEKITISIK